MVVCCVLSLRCLLMVLWVVYLFFVDCNSFVGCRLVVCWLCVVCRLCEICWLVYSRLSTDWLLTANVVVAGCALRVGCLLVVRRAPLVCLIAGMVSWYMVSVIVAVA
jgi:hypothetical protein